ncbi:MAG: LCP family protein [Actinomycetota bacterium]|nr:LCP family protein [Actinomycetota bacterium]
MSWIAVGLAVTVLATSAGGFVLIKYYASNISYIKGVIGNSALPHAPANAENVLLVGSDSRGDLKAGQGTQGVGASFVTGQRSDTVILAHLYGGNNKVQMVSFPRDSVVTIPEFTDPSTGRVHSEHRDRINASFAEGGPKLLVLTVEKLTGIRIDHYLQIDFNGFQTMVDTLGGVDVCLTTAAQDHYSGINLSAGRHHLNGFDALAFVRQRHGLARGDLDRIKRQQQFIGSMVHKVLSAGTLLNPLKLNGFLNAATKSLQVDSGLTIGNMKDLAIRFRGFNAGGVLFSTVFVDKINGYVPSLGSVVLLDATKNAALFDSLRRDIPPGTASAPPSAPSSHLIVAPSAIKVRVYNGSGIPGLGRKAATDLGDLHFQIVGTATTRGSGNTATSVLYGQNKADSARTLAASIPGSTMTLDPTLSDTLEVVTGTTYSGAHAVTISARPSASPTPSAAPALITAAQDPCAIA